MTNYSQRKEQYHEYLKSEEWQAVRQLVYDREQGTCQRCRRYLNGKFHAHHITYAYLFREQEALHTIACLCPQCHTEVHSKPVTWADLERRISQL